MKKNILVTGCGGFIGYHVTENILKNKSYRVIGIDNLNSYYSVKLKEDRIKNILNHPNFIFKKCDISIIETVKNIFKEQEIFAVINLAAQAGVRYSLENPNAYITSNIIGFANILELSKKYKVAHLIYASSSSVYGNRDELPLDEEMNVDEPISLYAATKKSNELMAHTYSHLYSLPTTGLRFFTVYGPWGRPDMAMHLFAEAILNNKPLRLFNGGKMLRDFTYIDDVTEAIVKLIELPPNIQNPNTRQCKYYRILNIGNNKPIMVSELVSLMERHLKKNALICNEDIQPGDVFATYANIENIFKLIGFKPQTSIEEGVKKFLNWYTQYHKFI